MPQIAHFQVEKWKSSLPWEVGHPLPHPPPARSLRSLAKIVPPKCFGSLRHCSSQTFDKSVIKCILNESQPMRVECWILYYKLIFMQPKHEIEKNTWILIVLFTFQSSCPKADYFKISPRPVSP